MINLTKVAHQIKQDPLYNTIYWEVKDSLNSKNPAINEIKELISKNSKFIDDYKEINRHSELSSIQVKELEIKPDSSDEKAKTIKDINDGILTLKQLENFSVDSSQSAYSIWIGSVGVMFVFIFHNIFSLFTQMYHTQPIVVYGIYSIIMFFTYLGYKKMKKNHELQFQKYKDIYSKTKKLISKGLEKKYFTYEELYIK